jgi:UDP-N-acetylmuramyl pentapeptide phosphotransferase/UDP-N-acetylglucosamine-1-phosphate transferase
MILLAIFYGALAAVLSWLGVRLIRSYAMQRQKEPDTATNTNTPRALKGGGVVIAVVVLLIFMPVTLSLGDPGQVVRFSVGGALIAMIGFVDDLRMLPRAVRLLAQAGAVSIFVISAPMLRIGLPFIEITLSLLIGSIVGVVWMVSLINAYNYMDGIDGLAGGQAVLAGGFWAGVGLVENDMLVLTLGLLLAGAAAGFLVYNLPPARIFMGDVGSAFLGFSLAALPMLAVSRGGSSRLMITGGLMVGLFMFDAVLTFFRYLLKRQDRRRPYRSHLYQRLVKLGEPPHLVTLLYLLLSTAFGIAGLIYWREAAWLALLLSGLACLTLYGWITYRERMGQPQHPQHETRLP